MWTKESTPSPDSADVLSLILQAREVGADISGIIASCLSKSDIDRFRAVLNVEIGRDNPHTGGRPSQAGGPAGRYEILFLRRSGVMLLNGARLASKAPLLKLIRRKGSGLIELEADCEIRYRELDE